MNAVRVRVILYIDINLGSRDGEGANHGNDKRICNYPKSQIDMKLDCYYPPVPF